MKLLISIKSFLLIFSTVLVFSSCLKVPQFDVMFSESQITANENDGKVTVELIMPGGTRKADVEVSYRYGGTAKEGKDYTVREENYIFIPGGSTSVSFDINLIDNNEEDGARTIVVAILLVVSNGNTIYQGAERQSVTIVINDDDCSPYLGGNWNYSASYYMYSDGDTARVGQDGNPLQSGKDPNFDGVITIVDSTGSRDYFISDILIGMFDLLDIQTPSPLYDNCGSVSCPNNGTIKVMQTLPANLVGTLQDENTIIVDFNFTDDENTGGGFGQAVLTRR